MSGLRAGEVPAAHADAAIAAHADELVHLAEAAIDDGLAHGRPPEVDVDACPPPLQARRAAFVTLFDARGALRGCIGTVVPRWPLAVEVSADAFGAAFRDPRFPPVTAPERGDLRCKVSVLTLPEPVPFADEAGIVASLRPGKDGVLIDGESGHGTFLPAVWESIPDRVDFWLALKHKAGLPLDRWPPDAAVYRYEAVTVG